MTARKLSATALLAVLASLATTGRAAAQWAGPYGGVAVGVGFGPRVGPWVGPGYWGGPYWGYPGFWGPGWGYYGWYPGAAGSFWTNGLSLYGAPAPTFAPVPGYFGGSDAHRTNLNPSPAHGPSRDFPPLVLPPGYRGPRFATADVRRRYAAQAADPMPGIERAKAEARAYDPWVHGWGWRRW